MMSRLVTIMLSGFLIAGAVGAEEIIDLVNASRAAAKTFGAALKDELGKAIDAGGATSGIAVCHDKAEQIAAKTFLDTGLTVGRTSLKVRNPLNTPDAWERNVLRQFEARRAQGEPPDQLEFHEVVKEGGGKTFRYMKAIPTASLCLGCHGEAIPPEVSAKLTELYPSDAARGFKEGDLRGAFTISRPL